MPELTTEEHAIVTRSEPAPVAELPATAKTETSTRVTSQTTRIKKLQHRYWKRLTLVTQGQWVMAVREWH